MTGNSLAVTIAILFGLSTVVSHAESYIVRYGDTLNSIALQEMGNSREWTKICENNKSLLKDCDTLAIGSVLELPINASSETIELTVKLSCEALGEIAPISVSLGVQLTGSALIFRRGEQGIEGYESWNGVVSESGTVSINGEYIEGSKQLKKLAFAGDIKSDGSIEANGKRGPRDCELISESLNL